MTAQTRRRPAARSWLLYPVFAVMALSARRRRLRDVGDQLGRRAAPVAGDRLVDVGGHRLNIRCVGSGSPTVVLEPGLGESASAIARGSRPRSPAPRVCACTTAPATGAATPPPARTRRATSTSCSSAHTCRGRTSWPATRSAACSSSATPTATRPSVGGVVLLDSMHPRQTHTAADMGPVLGVVPTIARTGLARLLVDAKDGEPAAQARQFVRDIEQMPAELEPGGAAQDASAACPLGVVTAGTGSAAGLEPAPERPGRLSTHSFHRTVAGSTHQSLIDDPKDAAASSRAIRDVVLAVRTRTANSAVPTCLATSSTTRIARRNAGPRSPRSRATTASCGAERPSAPACPADTRSGGSSAPPRRARRCRLLPYYVAERTTAVPIARVEIP